MNILFVVLPADTNSWVNFHIFDELSHCGHYIVIFNIGLYPCIDQANSELLGVSHFGGNYTGSQSSWSSNFAVFE